MSMIKLLQRKSATHAALVDVIAEMRLGDQGIKGDPSGNFSVEDALEICSNNPQNEQSAAYKILKNASENGTIANLQILDINNSTGGLLAYDKATDTYTVAFCGLRTNQGEHIDNAQGLYRGSTLRQEEAVHYFDSIIKKISPDTKVIVTGYGKGGNKAQYITLTAEERERIEQCIAVNGHGFSPEAVAAIKQRPDFEQQRSKITLVASENDHVHGVGIQLAPENQMFYLGGEGERDSAGNGEYENQHLIHNLFQEDGQLLQEVQQGPIATYVEKISTALMVSPMQLRQQNANKVAEIMHGDVSMLTVMQNLTDVASQMQSSVFQALTQNPAWAAILSKLPQLSQITGTVSGNKQFRKTSKSTVSSGGREKGSKGRGILDKSMQIKADTKVFRSCASQLMSMCHTLRQSADSVQQAYNGANRHDRAAMFQEYPPPLYNFNGYQVNRSRERMEKAAFSLTDLANALNLMATTLECAEGTAAALMQTLNLHIGGLL